jgi:hypothetical protein
METTSNQDPNEAPDNGGSNPDQDTSKSTTASGAEQDNSSPEEEHPAKPYIPKPGEDIELRKKFN